VGQLTFNKTYTNTGHKFAVVPKTCMVAVRILFLSYFRGEHVNDNGLNNLFFSSIPFVSLSHSHDSLLLLFFPFICPSQ
jgi:hypothetical protein